jgi:hypothetical protein
LKIMMCTNHASVKNTLNKEILVTSTDRSGRSVNE